MSRVSKGVNFVLSASITVQSVIQVISTVQDVLLLYSTDVPGTPCEVCVSSALTWETSQEIYTENLQIITVASLSSVQFVTLCHKS